jgi:hypothetical protein
MQRDVRSKTKLRLILDDLEHGSLAVSGSRRTQKTTDGANCLTVLSNHLSNVGTSKPQIKYSLAWSFLMSEDQVLGKFHELAQDVFKKLLHDDERASPAPRRSCRGRFSLSSPLDQTCYRIGRTRSLGKPVIYPTEIKVGVFSDLSGIVIADLFDKAPIAPGTAISDNDLVIGIIGCTLSAETNGNHGVVLF